MSILNWKNKVLGYTPQADGGNGSGGGGGSTNTTVNNTNIPSYAEPYVSNMLNAAQAQIYNPDMTGFNPYNPYSTNPQDYVASFSPLQQQAQSAAANLQLPSQFQLGTEYAGDAALGYGATASAGGYYGAQGSQAGQQAAAQSGMYGAQGAQIGQQAAAQSNMLARGAIGQGQQGAAIGASLGQMSTNPNAVGAYMNPYLQQSLAPAQQLLNQQYGMQGASQQGAATQQGAFGGSRNALMQGLNQQNQMLAQNQLVGNAYNQAFQQAQSQMNTANQAALAGNAQAQTGFGQGLQGANQAGQLGLAGNAQGLQGAQQQGQLAMQGAQVGLQGVGAQQAAYAGQNQSASNLANIGGQQLGAQQSIIGTQTQQGAAQQAQQQQMINQAIQNYSTAQQYPMLQLGMLNSMLRGLPMQSSTTAMYQAQPTATQQAIGLGGTAAALGSVFGKKEGGIVGMKAGGKVPGFKYGAVINDPQLEDRARALGAVQGRPGQPSPLQQRIQDPQVTPSERILFQGVQADQNRLRQVPGAGQMLQQAGQVPQMAAPQQPNPAMAEQARMSGLGAAGGNAFNSQGFAGGGIIAFADEGLVPEPKAPTNPTNPEEFAAAREAMMAKRGFAAGPTAEEKAYAESQQARGSDAVRDRQLALAAVKGFAKIGTTAAPGGLGQALLMGVDTALPGISAAYDAQETAKEAGLKAASDLKLAQRKFAAGDVDEAWKDYDSYQKNKTSEKVANINASVAGRQAASEKAYVDQLINQGYSLPDALQIVKGAGRADSVESSNAKIILKDINDQIFSLDPKKDAAKIAALEKQRQDIITNLQKQPQPGSAQQPGSQQSGGNPDAGGIVDIPGRGKFKQLPNGNYVKVQADNGS